jgi:hypothetical protein
MVGLYWKIPSKWIIWGHPHFRKPPYIYINVICSKVLKHPKAVLDGFPPK